MQPHTKPYDGAFNFDCPARNTRSRALSLSVSRQATDPESCGLALESNLSASNSASHTNRSERHLPVNMVEPNVMAQPCPILQDTFSGLPSCESASRWLRWAKRYYRHYRVPDCELAEKIGMSLIGLAEDWFDGLSPEETGDCDNIERAFLQRYCEQ